MNKIKIGKNSLSDIIAYTTNPEGIIEEEITKLRTENEKLKEALNEIGHVIVRHILKPVHGKRAGGV